MLLSRLPRFAALAAALAIGAAADAFGNEPGVTADSIRIGSFGALTGPCYLYGKLPMNGVEVVFDEVNAGGGIHGRKLQLVREDDRCDAAAAIAAIQKLVHQDQVFALIGGGCSNATFAAREAIETAKIPTLVFASVHDGITVPPAPNIYSTALTSSIESEAQVLFAQQQGAKRIAMVSMKDAWGRARYAPLMEILKAKGITLVADEELSPDANDATAQVLRLKAANADTVIMVLYPKPAAVYIRDAQKLGFKPLNIGQSGIADPAAFEEQVGVPGATASFRTISQVKFTPEDPAMDKWRKLVEAKFPGDRLSVYNLFGIGSAQVLVEALKRAGPDLTREKLQAAFASIKGFNTDVHPGPVTCSESDHRCHKSPAWLAKDPGGPIRVLSVTTVEN